MLKVKVMAFTTAALIACGLSSQAAAGEIGSGWYLGADMGRVELQLEDRGLISNKDLSDSAFAVHGGYRFSRYIAVESSYADIGDFGDQFGYMNISGRRIDLAIVGSIPLAKRFDAYAKLGVARTERELTIHNLNDIARFTDRNSDTIYGVGLRMHFDMPWSLRLQWDRSQLGGYQPNVDALWFGAEYRFGNR